MNMSIKKSIAISIFILSAVMLFTPVVTQAKSKSKEIAITKKSFPNKKLRNSVRKKFDKDKNGKLSPKEIRKATKFTTKLTNENLNVKTNLKGISYLKYLKKLEIKGVDTVKNGVELGKLRRLEILHLNNSNYVLGKIDATCFYHLKQLKELSFNEINVTNANKINKMKNLEKFKWLYVIKDLNRTGKYNKKSFSLKGFQSRDKLKKLILKNVKINQISELKHFKRLEELRLYNNKIKKIDVSKNAQLKVINIEKNPILECNNDKNYQLREFTLIDTNIVFFRMVNRDNIKDVTLTTNNRLKKVQVENCPDMTALWVSGDRLQEFQIVNTPNIYSIWLGAPKTVPKLIYPMLYKLDNLTIDVKGNTFDFTKFPNISKLFYHIELPIDSINLSSNIKIKDLSIWAKGSLNKLDISALSELQNLSCGNCEIKELVLGTYPKLQRMNCQNNKLTGSMDLSGSPLLSDLDCHNNQLSLLDVHDCKKLFTMTCDNNKLDKINIAKTILYRFYCRNNPDVNIYATHTVDHFYKDKSAKVHYMEGDNIDLW